MLKPANYTDTSKGRTTAEIQEDIQHKATGIWAVLKLMQGTLGVQSHFTMVVLYKLCKNADPAGFVQIPNRQLWLADLECSKQQFSNALRILKRSDLLERCPGGYQLSDAIPFNITYPYSYTIKFNLV